jgi:WD40 repeat protein
LGSKATCNCIQFTSDGRNIVSGWSDGVVRFFTPQTGRLLYLIKDAHKKTSDVVTQVSGVVARPKFYWADGVTAISASQDCKTLISGGSDCEVKLWEIGKQTTLCLIHQRVHKAAITTIKHIENDKKAASSSIDGQIVIWDLLQKGKGAKPLLKIGQLDTLPTKGFDGQIKCGVTHLAYNEKTNELLALGQDHRVTYWDLKNMKSAKQLQAGFETKLNAFAVSPDG